MYTAGVLHAPGYVLYSCAGWLVDQALPGGPAFAANALAALATLSALAVLALFARSLTGTTGAAVSVVGLGTAASTWYFAGAAEHNASSLLVSAVAMVGLLQLARSGANRVIDLVALGVGVGLAAASTPMTAASVLAGAGFVVLTRRDRFRRALLAAGVALLTAIGVILLTYLRAHAEPPINWGDATSMSRMVELLSASDFRGPGSSVSGASDGGESVGLPGDLGDLTAVPKHLVSYLAVVVRDLGPVVVVLAGIGFGAARKSAPRIAAVLAVVITTNLLLLALMVGVRLRGFESGLFQGSLLQPTLIAATIAAAYGIAPTVRFAMHVLRRFGTGGLQHDVVAACACLVAIAAPAAITRYAAADHRHPDFGEEYAADVFEELPDGSILVVWGAERAFPLWHAQVVKGVRSDVDVVAGDMLDLGWYREQISEQLGPVPDVGDAFANTNALITGALSRRNVMLDSRAWVALGNTFRLTQYGITAEAIPGEPRTPPEDIATVVERVQRLAAEPWLQDDATQRWPNQEIIGSYVSALLLASNAAGVLGEETQQASLLQSVLTIDPDNTAAHDALAVLAQRSGG